MKLAIHQTPGRPGEPAANLDALRPTADRAAAEGVDLLVLPEMWLTGYNIGEPARSLAEPADGPAAGEVAAIARAAGIAILYGYPERAGERVYNAAQLVDATGARRANTRKTHLFGPTERALFAPGEAAGEVVRCAGVGLATLICYDVEFPEAVRAAALRGAELVVVPTALFRPYDFIASHVVRVRAWENQAYVAYANRCGQEGDLEYVGGSSICAPDGRVIARAAAGEALIAGIVDPAVAARCHEENPYLRDRRPELYGPPA